MSLPQKAIRTKPIVASKPTHFAHDMTWSGVTYTRVPPGIYDVCAVAVQGPEWCRAFRRWSLRLEFSLLSEDGTVSRFFNMGSNPEKPHIGRKSLYFKWWVAANGDLPWRGQKMTPDVFFDGTIFKVSIEDACIDDDKKAKHHSEVYSRVVELKEVVIAQSSNHSIIQSAIHPIKQSTNQGSLRAVAEQNRPRRNL